LKTRWCSPGAAVGAGPCGRARSLDHDLQAVHRRQPRRNQDGADLDGRLVQGDSEEAIIDTDVFVANAKKFGTFCAANPSISIVNAAEKILGD
jgi:hypothetical protein